MAQIIGERAKVGDAIVDYEDKVFEDIQAELTRRRLEGKVHEWDRLGQETGGLLDTLRGHTGDVYAVRVRFLDGGRTLVESSVIIEYLDLHHPGPVAEVGCR